LKKTSRKVALGSARHYHPIESALQDVRLLADRPKNRVFFPGGRPLRQPGWLPLR